jgi:tRNA-2-methylthio-N6-dimethylallyladenosine synthase
VPDPVKSERLAVLQALLARQQQEFNRACVGRVLPVLLEKPGRHAGQLVGRSPYLQSVHLTANREQVGDVVPVLIAGAGQNSLSGTVAS